MKNIVYLLCTFLLSAMAFAQLSDGAMAKYTKVQSPKEKSMVIYAEFVSASSADSLTIVKAIRLGEWFKREDDIEGSDYIDLYLANVFGFKGDYNSALNLALPILERFRRRKDDYGIMLSNHAIALSYAQSKNWALSFDYAKKAIALAERISPKQFLSTAYNDLAVDYSIAKMPDSGLVYAQKAINIDMSNKDNRRLCASLSTMGENYMAAGEYEIALPFLRKSMGFFKTFGNRADKYSLVYALNDFGQAFLALKQHDSARFYTRKSIAISENSGFNDQLLRSYEYMYASFEQTNSQDSVNAYFRKAMAAKDELFSLEKMQNLETMKFREQIRQQELEVKIVEAENQRHQNIQFILIGTFIISFFIVFLMLSRTVIVNEKWISFLAILALLLVFEFVNLLIHPFLEKITHHSPVLMLLGLVILASMLIPMHHRLEHFISHKLTGKNKAIRLAAAKKTIAQFENETRAE
ncbi:MAG: hypothetical protein EOO50_06090 [Flavobacterium sp.]|uniref:tetratricopeptide repeat protein n=1 Tax=Flavobacterium sp. TaxID=239 RepID=UPI00120C38F9|nr:tetratricopeptide repeat protein [Flavobacterium sp.]RZJ67312.1 MAG: hypothetical protein EOO50_06090 [Flavobacterium sp.]